MGIVPRARGAEARLDIPPAAAANQVMSNSVPPWQVLRRVTAYDSPWVRIHRDDVRLPDGQIIEGHHVIDVPRPAVSVVPLGPDGRLLLIEHYRFITQTTGWEAPAGSVDPGEDLLAAAGRELREETGHGAETMEKLGQYHPSNGISNQVFHVYVGRGVRRVGELTDTNEVMRTNWFTLGEVRAMLQRNEIRDGLSMTSLLWYVALHG